MHVFIDLTMNTNEKRKILHLYINGKSDPCKERGREREEKSRPKYVEHFSPTISTITTKYDVLIYHRFWWFTVTRDDWVECV